MFSKNRSARLGMLVGLAGATLAGSALADQTVVLNTATTLVYQAPNRTNPKPRQRDCPGVVDPAIAFDRSTLDVFAIWTNSVPWGGNTGLDTGCQAAMAFTKLTETGLATPVVKMLPNQKGGQRVAQRFNVLLGKNFIAAVFADENNGRNNGNPQPVVWVFDRSGNRLPISNAGDANQQADDPVNLYTLSGQNDDQQLSPHDQAQLPDEADGSQSWAIGLQYNNQKAKVMKVNIASDGTSAQVHVPYLTTVVQNAQHCRPVFATPTDGLVHNNKLTVVSVDANGQPRTNGVRAVLFDTTNGKVLSSTLFASDKTNKIYNVQPSVAYISDNVVALEYQRSSPADGKQFIVNRNNGHVAAPNLSHLATLQVPTTNGDDFKILQEADRVALQNRHAAAFGLEYGPDGTSSGAIGVLSASSTGTGSGYAQIIPIDPVKGTFDTTPDPMKAYQVAQYADVAGLAAATLRDPGQARAFFKAVHGLPNPSYKNTAGFMPEVKTFNISAVAGYANPSTDNMESLTFALLPSVWDPAYATTPGAATPNVPPGPSPAPPAGTPVTNPSGPSAGTGAGGQDTGGTSGTSGTGASSGGGSVTGGSGGVHAPGYGTGLSTSSGCGCTTAGADRTSGVSGLAALGLGFAFLGIRRRSQKKGS